MILQTHIMYFYPNYLAWNRINVSPSSAVTGTRYNKRAMISLNINILSLPEHVSNWLVHRKALLTIPRLHNHPIIIPILTELRKAEQKTVLSHDSACLHHQFTFLVKPIKFLTQFKEKAIMLILCLITCILSW